MPAAWMLAWVTLNQLGEHGAIPVETIAICTDVTTIVLLFGLLNTSGILTGVLFG